jgi:hypothetical protein
MNVHTIRLRPPWRLERSSEGVVWRRAFHRPSGLGPGDRVWLAMENCPAAGLVELNGQTLGSVVAATGLQRFDVTAGLLGRNELSIVFSQPLPTDRSEPCEVRLVIENATLPEGECDHLPRD